MSNQVGGKEIGGEGGAGGGGGGDSKGSNPSSNTFSACMTVYVPLPVTRISMSKTVVLGLSVDAKD